jgi:hypothetical protein
MLMRTHSPESITTASLMMNSRGRWSHTGLIVPAEPMAE